MGYYPSIPVYYVISHYLQNPMMITIHHVVKVHETTLDKIDQIYEREVVPLQATGMHLTTLILDRPANLDFLKQLEQASKEGGTN